MPKIGQFLHATCAAPTSTLRRVGLALPLFSTATLRAMLTDVLVAAASRDTALALRPLARDAVDAIVTELRARDVLSR